MGNPAAKRKYALAKIAAGDWLLPSNDLTTLWRVQRYEDGPHYGLDPEVFPRDFTAWQLWRWPEPFSDAGRIDFDNWDRWVLVATSFDKRQDAIDEALRLSGGGDSQ